MARAKLLQYNDLISTFCWFDKGGLSLAYADSWYYNENSFVSDVLVLIRFVLSVCQVSFASLAKYLENWLSKNDPDLFSFPVLPNIGARV